MTSDFRNAFGVYKIREINDCHHAQDAYLSIIMGAYIQKVYPFMAEDIDYNDYNYYRENCEKLAKENIKFDREEKENSERKSKYGFVIRSMNYYHSDKEGEITWDPETDKIKIIKAFDYKDYFITKKVEENNSSFYDINLLKKSKTEVRIPMGKINEKSLDPVKYGGYSGETKAYFSVVEYDIIEKSRKEEKNIHKRDIIGIPIQKSYLIKNKKTDLYDVALSIVKKNLNSKQTLVENSLKIIKKKICKYQLIEQDGSRLYITSQDYVINGKYFILDKKYHKLIFDIVKNKLESNQNNISLLFEFYDYYLEKLNNNYKMYVNKDYVNKLRNFKNKFENLDFESKQKFLLTILKMIKLVSCQLDLKKDFGLISGFGMLSNYKLSKDTIFIDQSVTGLKENVYKL